MPSTRKTGQDRVADQAAIREITLRYARGVDRRDHGLLVSCFTDDAPLLRDGELLATGAQAIAQRIVDTMKQYRATMHLNANHLAEMHGDTATAETYAVAHHWYLKEGSEWEYRMYIRYMDNLVQQDGQWRFKRRELIVDQRYHLQVPKARA